MVPGKIVRMSQSENETSFIQVKKEKEARLQVPL